MSPKSSVAKRRRAKGRQKPRVVPATAGLLGRDHELSERAWRFTFAAIVIAAALLRLVYLSDRPLHHDEGVNGYFMFNLFTSDTYRYDPTNYHGPTLYYFGLLTTTANSFLHGKAGLSTFAIRLVPALFGVLIVWLALNLRGVLGKFGAIAAALLLACSPGQVFFSRYFIHEILLACFTLGVIVAAMRFHLLQAPRYLRWGAASAALLCATKETWVITISVLLAAAACSYYWAPSRDRKIASTSNEQRERRSDATPQGLLKDRKQLLGQACDAIIVFVFVWVLLYSSFFANFPRGVYDSLLTFKSWTATGTTAYVAPWFTYPKWIWQEELPIVILGAAGIAVSLWQRWNRFAIFLAFWALGIAVAYSAIPYKTPWLSLNISTPLAIVGGYGLGWLYDLGKSKEKTAPRFVAVVALAVAVIFSAYQAVQLSLFRYDDDTLAYSYAHTSRDFIGLLDDIQTIEADNHLGSEMGITVMSPEHWPLFWYLRWDQNVAYEGKIVTTKQPVIIALESQTDEVEKRFGQEYQRASSHELRPGTTLVLYLRRDLIL